MIHANPINFKTIPSKEHRYPTCGDYWIDSDGAMQVRVSQMEDPRYEQLVLLHELIEVFLLQHKGVSIEDVDAFDKMFENERDQGKHSQEAEPGDDPRCPYKREHKFAENIERLIALEMGVHWDTYNTFVEE